MTSPTSPAQASIGFAVGGTAEDEDGAIVNRTWALSAYISVQYAEIVQGPQHVHDYCGNG